VNERLRIHVVIAREKSSISRQVLNSLTGANNRDGKPSVGGRNHMGRWTLCRTDPDIVILML